MIKPNTLEHAEYLIGMAGVVDSGFYQFYVDLGTLCLAKFNPKEAHTYELLQVASHDINNGLTTKQWNRLAAAIRTARKEGILK